MSEWVYIGTIMAALLVLAGSLPMTRRARPAIKKPVVARRKERRPILSRYCPHCGKKI